MDSDYGAAEGLISPARKFYRVMNKYFGGEEPSGKVDTSWHDEMVKKANESFAKKNSLSKNRKLGSRNKKSQQATMRKRSKKRD